MDDVKLKDPSGMFLDPETGLRVMLSAVVPLREPRGRLTQQWLNAGGLIVVKHADAPHREAPNGGRENAGEGAPPPGGEEVSSFSPSPPTPEPEDLPPVDEEKALLAMTARDLRTIAKDRGIAVSRWDKKAALVKKILAG